MTKRSDDPYKRAGVDIDAGDRLARAFAPLARATRRPGGDPAIGGFGGLFDLKAAGFKDSILVSGADGVGTKLKLAFATGRHDGVGVDLVAMCANDVLAQGAEPLFFLDYFATGALDEETALSVVAGVAKGCERAGCALLGGETAEMPDMYAPGEYDLAGFCVGAAERDALLPEGVAAGDVMIALASSGAHANGFSLIRKIIADHGFDLARPAPFDSARTLGEALLEPTRIYAKAFLAARERARPKAFAHITGGGLIENVPRVLPEGLAPRYDETALAPPPLFAWLQEAGAVTTPDMRRIFNGGVGAVALVAPENADDAIAAFEDAGERAFAIGDVGPA